MVVGAKAFANMKLVEHESTFNSQGNAESSWNW
jgi:hypothetical protein